MWEWGELKARTGWEPLRVAVERDGRFLATAQVLKRSVPGLGKSLFYSPGGPLLAPDTDRAVFTELIDELDALAATHGAMALKIDPAVLAGDEQYASMLSEAGFRPAEIAEEGFGGTQPLKMSRSLARVAATYSRRASSATSTPGINNPDATPIPASASSPSTRNISVVWRPSAPKLTTLSTRYCRAPRPPAWNAFFIPVSWNSKKRPQPANTACSSPTPPCRNCAQQPTWCRSPSASPPAPNKRRSRPYATPVLSGRGFSALAPWTTSVHPVHIVHITDKRRHGVFSPPWRRIVSRFIF